MRCPISWAINSATRKRQSICSDTLSRASYSASVRSTLAGFFCLGVLRPLSGLDSRRSLPSSFLDLAAQLRTASRNFRSYSMVRSDTGRPLGPTLPARRARINRSQSRWESVLGLRCLPKNLRKHRHRGSLVPPRPLGLGGDDLFPVDVKQRLQGERLGLGWCFAVELRIVSDQDARHRHGLPMAAGFNVTDPRVTDGLPVCGADVGYGRYEWMAETAP